MITMTAPIGRAHARAIPAPTTILAALAIAVAAANPASAQDLSPVSTMLNTVFAALTGPIAQAVAGIAIVITGFILVSGQFRGNFIASVLAGIVLMFSAGTIVAGFAT